MPKPLPLIWSVLFLVGHPATAQDSFYKGPELFAFRPPAVATDLVEWKSSGQITTGGTTATISPSAPVLGVVTVTPPFFPASGPAISSFNGLHAKSKFQAII